MKQQEQLTAEWEKIHQSIKSYQSGETANVMYSGELASIINYGLSIHQIIHLAGKLKSSEDLSFYLQLQKIREAKLLALFLFPSQLYTTDKIIEIAMSLDHQEQVEVWVQYILKELPLAHQFCIPLIEHEHSFAQKTGTLLTGKLAYHQKLPLEIIEDLFKKLRVITLTETKHNRSLAYALAQLYLNYPAINHETRRFFEEIARLEKTNLLWLSEEIKTICGLYE